MTDFSREIKAIGVHAGTTLIGQLASMSFAVVDAMVAGQHSGESLAALSVGTAVYFSIFIGLMGVLQALLPIWAEYQGANRPLELGRSFRQAIYISLLAWILGLLALLNPQPLLHWTSVPLSIQAGAQDYLSVLALALAPALWFRMYSTLNQSIGHPRLVTLIQLGAIGFKIPLTAALCLGIGDFEGLGATGCAWATVVVTWGMLGIALVLIRRQPLYTRYDLWRRPEAPNAAVLTDFLKIGIPAGLTIMIEVTSFTLMALFIARMGTAVAASHQIATNVAAVLYMVPLSLGIATSARVGFWTGRDRHGAARSAMLAGLSMAAVMAITLSTIVWLSRETLAQAYSPHAQVVTLAAALLPWVACYHIVDAIQAVTVFVLRCYRITGLPMLIYGVVLWGVGLVGGYMASYSPQAQATTAVLFWQYSAGALSLATLIMLTLLLNAVSQPPLREKGESAP
jgi:multidrug resistance protein, MATE family